MSLRSKIVLILIAVVVLYAAIDNGTLRLYANPVFESWEREEAQEDLARVQSRITSELHDLSAMALVYASWDSLGRFLGDPREESIRANLDRQPLDRAGVDLFYVCDGEGKVLWRYLVDPTTRAPIRLRDFPGEALFRRHPAIAFRALEGRPEEQISDLMMTELHPLLVVSRPIPAPDGTLFAPESDGYRPACGAVILGRFLGPELKRRIEREELELGRGVEGVTQVELIEQAPAVDLPAELVHGTAEEVFAAGADGRLHAYQKIPALRTGAPLVLHVALDRAIASRGRAGVNYALLSTLAGALVILFVLLRLLEKLVVKPLSQLTSKAVEIGRRDDTSIRVGLDREDEIGQLASEFDRMLEKLARSRELVIQTARLAGMSEIATGVLHSVGNVLNSVNVSANLAAKKADQLSTGDLELLVAVLHKNERDLAAFVSSDPRGKHLVPFLNELVRALGVQKKAIQEELRSLNQGIEHIAELVRAQQNYAGARGVFERAALEEQLEAALRICGQTVGPGTGIEIVREYEPLPPVRIDKHKLMEILVNLITNAGQALAEGGAAQKRLTLRLARAGEGLARLEVIDNGVGIPSQNLTRIFHHGFTTKKDGHGFGLHVSANAATEMGAKLHARSDGPGKGATFALDLSMEEEVALAAAA